MLVSGVQQRKVKQVWNLLWFRINDSLYGSINATVVDIKGTFKYVCAVNAMFFLVKLVRGNHNKKLQCESCLMSVMQRAVVSHKIYINKLISLSLSINTEIKSRL